jgi:hypothetical protein
MIFELDFFGVRQVRRLAKCRKVRKWTLQWAIDRVIAVNIISEAS